MNRMMVTLCCVAIAAATSATVARAQAEPASTRAVPGTPSDASLRAGDVLRLRIWREDDLSGDFQVDEMGVAILPRLGPTIVTGVPVSKLRERLITQYQEYLNNPSVEIIPLRRISILGAVKNPGIHRIDPSITLGEAVNLAGGPTPASKRNKVELRRGNQRWEYDLQHQPERASVPLTSGDQIWIPERSWLSQNATWFISTLVGIAGTAAYLIVVN